MAPTMSNFIEMSSRLEQLQKANAELSAQLKLSRSSTHGKVNAAVFDQLERIASRQLQGAAQTQTAPNASAPVASTGANTAEAMEEMVAATGAGSAVEAGLSVQVPDTVSLSVVDSACLFVVVRLAAHANTNCLPVAYVHVAIVWCRGGSHVLVPVCCR